jgi:hypothetical protein
MNRPKVSLKLAKVATHTGGFQVTMHRVQDYPSRPSNNVGIRHVTIHADELETADAFCTAVQQRYAATYPSDSAVIDRPELEAWWQRNTFLIAALLGRSSRRKVSS